jgi:hypothetical protein
MRVLAEKPEHGYLQVIFDDEDVEAFRHRLVKSGSFAGWPIRVSTGKRVGTVLSGAAWNQPFEHDGEHYDGAALFELKFDSPEFMQAAKEADLTLEDDAVVILGDDAGDHEGVQKSSRALLSEELRRGFGFS